MSKNKWKGLAKSYSLFVFYAEAKDTKKAAL